MTSLSKNYVCVTHSPITQAGVSPTPNPGSDLGNSGLDPLCYSYFESNQSYFEPSLPEYIFDEFRLSKVPDRLTSINVSYRDGDAAINLLIEHAVEEIKNRKHINVFLRQSQIKNESRKLKKRHSNAFDGVWVAYGCTVEGDRGAVPLAKPVKPRQAQEFKGFGSAPKVKTVKYETPAKCPALPILPWIDDETAFAIYNRYGVTPELGENFWQVVLRCNVPIAVTEGLKKALSLIAHGMPAIAVRGVTQWRVTGTDDLHPTIAQFATQSRVIYIAFDQDEKLKTQINVRGQVKKLGAALEKSGCKAWVIAWDGALGKGIDDVLYGQEDNAQAWLDSALQSALTLKRYAAEGMRAAALATLRRMAQSVYPVERFTEGKHLPKMAAIKQGDLYIVDGAMNIGKSFAIGRDLLPQARQMGLFTIVFSPLNALGKQAAEDWKFPHIRDTERYPNTPAGQARLWSDARDAGGVVLCTDSTLALPLWITQSPLLIVMDEGNAVVNHTLTGETIKDKWSPVVYQYAELLQHAAKTGAIIMAEDGIPDRAINFVKTVSGAKSVRVFRHRKRGEPWNCQVMRGHASGFWAMLIQAAMSGEPLLFAGSSQKACRRLQRVLAKIAPHLNVVRIDSETNQRGAFDKFFQNPDRWIEIHKPDVLILSPSAQSGVSIEGNVTPDNAYFRSVWGYFPALATDSHMQLLGRYRPSVPRFIFCPDFIQCSGDESLYTPRAIMRRLQLNASALSGVYEVAALLDGSERSDRHIEIEAAALEYISESLTVTGAQKSIAHDALVARLEDAGHHVKTIKVEKNVQIAEFWKQVTEEIWQDDSAESASVQVKPSIHTSSWAHKLLDSAESTRENRLIAQKVLLREEFPGVSFDSSDEWYQAIYSDYGAMRRGVNLQARSENLYAAKERDRGAAERILGSNIRALHRLPKSHIKALALQKTGILTLLDGTPYSNSDKRAIAVKAAALKWAKEISYWLRLQINDTQTPVEICNKLLKKLGLEGKAIARPGKRGQQSNRLYRVEGQDNPIRQRLIEASRRKLSEFVSTARIRDEQSHLQIMDTPTHPPDTGEWVRPGALDEAREMVAAAAGDVETLEYLQSLIPSTVWEAIAA